MSFMDYLRAEPSVGAIEVERRNDPPREIDLADHLGRSRGDRVVAGLRGRATTQMSTDDILALTRTR